MAEYDVTTDNGHSAERGTDGEWHRVFLEVERENFKATFGVHNWYEDSSTGRREINVSDQRWGEGPMTYFFYPEEALIVADGMEIQIPQDVAKEFMETIEDKALPEGGV